MTHFSPPFCAVKMVIARALQDLPYQWLNVIIYYFINFIIYIYFVVTPSYNLEATRFITPLNSQWSPRTESQIAPFRLLS